MRNIRKNCMMLVALFGLTFATEAKTDVTVELKNGDQNKTTVEDEGFIYFSGDVMNIVPSAASEDKISYPLSNVKKLLFKDLAGTARVLKEGEVVLYPSIATSQVNLANATNEIEKVTVLDANGKIVLNAKYEAGQPINISQLNAGWYTLKAGKSTFKFVKK